LTDGSDAEQGYRTGLGFCSERIAWIHHLLANDFLCDAMSEPNSANKIAKLRTAVSDAEAALKIRKGAPFDQTSATNLATDVVRDSARAELQKFVK
jgi:hypothetical protein